MKPQLTFIHVHYSICVCILCILDKTTTGKTVPSEMLELIAPRTTTLKFYVQHYGKLILQLHNNDD